MNGPDYSKDTESISEKVFLFLLLLIGLVLATIYLPLWAVRKLLFGIACIGVAAVMTLALLSWVLIAIIYLLLSGRNLWQDLEVFE